LKLLVTAPADSANIVEIIGPYRTFGICEPSTKDLTMFGKKTLATVFCAALISVSALAQDGGPGGFGRHRGMGGDMAFLHGITLTDAQQAQLKDIMHANRAQMKPMMQQMRALQTQKADQLFSAGAVNSAQLAALQQQISQLKGQIDAQRLSMIVAARGVLTSAQLAQAAQLHQQMTALHAQERSLMNPSGAQQ
jgi:Spy/CpxP family protein refolding chaperone